MNTKHLLLFAYCITVHTVARAHDGALDPSFGELSQAWIDVSPSNTDSGQKMIGLPNGNLFMGGRCSSATKGQTCAAWLTPTGALATGYGPTGNGTVSLSAFAGWPTDTLGTNDVAALPDGRVALVVPRTGSSSASGYLALLSQNGAGLDSSIGNGAGYVFPSFAPLFIRPTSQNKLIVVGLSSSTPYTCVFARFNSDFRLDTTFGSSGTTTISFSDGSFIPENMALQSDGKILAIGGVLGTQTSLGIVRLTTAGQPDVDFGINSDGRFESRFGAYSALGNDIIEDKQGRLAFAGSSGSDAGSDAKWIVGRLLSGGAVDPSFNGGATQQFTIAASSTAFGPSACCVALQRDGRIVVAGTVDRTEADLKYFGLARFNNDGSFDNNFGGSGQSYADLSPEGASAVTDTVSSVVIVPGGIIVAGHTEIQGGEVRFTAAKEMIDLLFANGFE
jgi:uncharacterized delta-60 repeat protein